jgi:PAS domain-containing protein
MPDAFVVTDTDRRVLSANAAFVDLVQVASEEQARGEPLDRWLGQSAVDLAVLIANLKGTQTDPQTAQKIQALALAVQSNVDRMKADIVANTPAVVDPVPVSDGPPTVKLMLAGVLFCH